MVDAAGAARVRKPAGWVVTALRDDWDVTDVLVPARAVEARRRNDQEDESERRRRARAASARGELVGGWAAALSASLDDDGLAAAVAAVTTSVAGVGRPSVPLARAQLVAWAVAAHAQRPDQALPDALRAALADDPRPAPAGERLPAAPTIPGAVDDLNQRLAGCLDRPLAHAADRAGDRPDDGMELP